jgi:hypothetical protein
MRRAALLLWLIAGMCSAGPIYTDLDAQPAAAASADVAALPLPLKSGPSLSAAIRLRNLPRFGRGFAAAALAVAVRPAEENLGVMRPDNYDPSRSRVDAAFLSAIGLSPAGLARHWGEGDAITSLEDPFGLEEVYYDFETPGVPEIKADIDKYKGSLAEVAYWKNKIHYTDGDALPVMESVGWVQELLAFIHKCSQAIVNFILDHLIGFIALNGIALFWIHILRRGRS